MKKISIILAALAACFAVSCTKEAPTTEPQDPSAPAGMKKVTITATAEGATKTTYTDNGEGRGVFSWTEGDQISVMGKDYNFYTLTAEQTGSSVSFSGYIPEGVTLRQEAFFPAAEHYREGSSYYFHIPEYKDMSEHFSADLPMGACSGTDTYQFMHITGAALLTFTNFPTDIETAEIAIVNTSLKLSGKFGTWTDDALWVYGVAEAANESEGKFVRKVPVTDGQAQVYLPYACDGNLWAKCDVSITGYDSKGTAKVLLAGKTMNSFSTFGRAQVVPCSPLELPDYVPPVDWTKVDWETDNVVTSIVDPSASYSTIKEMKVIADKYYVYVRLNASSAISFVDVNGAANKFLDVYMSNGEVGDGSFQIYSSRWTTSGTVNYYNDAYTKDGVVVGARWEHAGEFDADGNLTKMRFYLPDDVSRDDIKDMKTEVVGEDIYWYIAYPRANVDYYKSSDNHLYISFMMWEGWNTFGVIPTKGAEMLEVTLP